MILEDVKSIATNFQLEGEVNSCTPITIGHIHKTYLLSTIAQGFQYDYILQRINTKVFRQPYEVMSNIQVVAQHLKASDYQKDILTPIATVGDNKEVIYISDSYHWRVFPFFKNTVTYNIVQSPSMAYDVAYTFGEYARYLDNLNCNQLYETIPDFHNTPLRYQSYIESRLVASEKRLKNARSVISGIEKYQPLLKYFPSLHKNIRAVHYDTKVNNVLMDKAINKAVCVIDLDTIMPGMLSYDFGDMVRTMTPLVDENSRELEKVIVQENILRSLNEGFLDGLEDKTTAEEKGTMMYGAALIIYEQALRFISDYFRGNTYYPVEYESQNLIRAQNQMKLLSDFVSKAIPNSL